MTKEQTKKAKKTKKKKPKAEKVEAGEEGEAPKKKKKKKKKDGYMKLLAVSEELAPILGATEIRRSDVRGPRMRISAPEPC